MVLVCRNNYLRIHLSLVGKVKGLVACENMREIKSAFLSCALPTVGVGDRKAQLWRTRNFLCYHGF